MAGAIPDTIPDDAFILYESTNGPVLIFGCCHSGIANSFACLRQRYGIDHVYGVLGGMHLHDASQEVIEQSARIFDKFHVQEIHAGHCTGKNLGGGWPTCAGGESPPWQQVYPSYFERLGTQANY